MLEYAGPYLVKRGAFCPTRVVPREDESSVPMGWKIFVFAGTCTEIIPSC